MTNNFPSFLDTSPGTGISSNVPRLAPSPIAQQQQQINGNGNGAGMNGLPIAAGQQADVNFLFQKVVELSEVLKENREKTAGIIAGAEELAVSVPVQAFVFEPQRSLTQLFHFRLALQQREQVPPSKKPTLKSPVSQPLAPLKGPATNNKLQLPVLPNSNASLHASKTRPVSSWTSKKRTSS